MVSNFSFSSTPSSFPHFIIFIFQAQSASIHSKIQLHHMLQLCHIILQHSILSLKLLFCGPQDLRCISFYFRNHIVQLHYPRYIFNGCAFTISFVFSHHVERTTKSLRILFFLHGTSQLHMCHMFNQRKT